MTASVLGVGQAPLDCASHPLQHILDYALGARERLHVTGPQPTFVLDPRTGSKNDSSRSPPRVGPSGLAELRANVALALVRATRFREHANAGLELGPRLVEHSVHIEGTPAITITLPIQKQDAPDTLFRTRSAPLGMRVMRRGPSFISAPVTSSHSSRMASARGSVSIGTPERLRHVVGGDVRASRPIPREDMGVAMPKPVDRVDGRCLLIADHPHFLSSMSPPSDIPRHSEYFGPCRNQTRSCRRSPEVRP
jgi:hypothetical protein